MKQAQQVTGGAKRRGGAKPRGRNTEADGHGSPPQDIRRSPWLGKRQRGTDLGRCVPESALACKWAGERPPVEGTQRAWV